MGQNKQAEVRGLKKRHEKQRLIHFHTQESHKTESHIYTVG